MNPDLVIKMERIQKLQSSVNNLNQKLIRGDGIDQVDLTEEDVQEYSNLYNSDNEEEDQDDEEYPEIPEEIGPEYNEIDENFSGNYKFFADVRY